MKIPHIYVLTSIIILILTLSCSSKIPDQRTDEIAVFKNLNNSYKQKSKVEFIFDEMINKDKNLENLVADIERKTLDHNYSRNIESEDKEVIFIKDYYRDSKKLLALLSDSIRRSEIGNEIDVIKIDFDNKLRQRENIQNQILGLRNELKEALLELKLTKSLEYMKTLIENLELDHSDEIQTIKELQNLSNLLKEYK